MSPFHTAGDDSIDEQAANWFARNRNTRNQGSCEQFNAWHANPSHARAYTEFESLWADLGELEQINSPAPLPAKPRRAHFALATAAAVLCAVFALNLGAPVALHQQQVSTLAQGARTILLPDGSTLNVNANTRLSLDFSAHQRDIYLDQASFTSRSRPTRSSRWWCMPGRRAYGWSARGSMYAAVRANWWSAWPTARLRSSQTPGQQCCWVHNNAPPGTTTGEHS